jgi:glycine/D-amino acid oxidase-like deaminating enzyme
MGTTSYQPTCGGNEPDMVLETPPDLGRSWWLVDALESDPGEPAPALAQDTTADVVILGGGYTGMWTAWFLKERDPGIDIAILEADICGGGPSGRNGGFLDSWWGHVADMTATFGDSDALSLLQAAAPSPTEVGAWCKQNGVDAWFRNGGDLAVTTNRTQEGKWVSTIEAAERIGVGDRFQVLSPEQVKARCDSPMFGSGMYVADAATVHPARLARGLRRVLLEKGVRIFESSPVTRFGRGKPAIAETPRATVRAGEAIVALGAWATPWKAFRPYMTVRGSYMVMTEPAPELLENIGWTGSEAVRSMRASIHYLRTTPDGRIAFGLGGLQPNLGTKVDHRYAYDEVMVRRVALDLHRMFPAFKDVPLAAGWGGPINVSGYNLPFFGTTKPGNVHHGLGYTGNGVGPSHLGGKILASLATHADDEFTRLAVVTREPKRFPPEPIRSPGVLLANEAIRRKDDLEDAGRHVSPLTNLTAGLPRKLGFNLGPRTW